MLVRTARTRIALQLVRDGIWIGRDVRTRRLLGSFVGEGSGWWYACRPDGTTRRLRLPGADEMQVARRLLTPGS